MKLPEQVFGFSSAVLKKVIVRQMFQIDGSNFEFVDPQIFETARAVKKLDLALVLTVF